ncbi:alpha/beta fold hydrolase [Actinomadura sp. SCN-SB]|uniref:alpha/beta fold hydrolase n=1 Tax=Actinomadura sp. SCN-SB TaxID=3373092 RepID=UPI003752CFA0
MSESEDIVVIAGAELERRTLGSGPPLLFLHGEDGHLFTEPVLRELAGHFEVTAPSHPGWGRSPRSRRYRDIDDVAYLYLDLLESMEGPVTLMGVSLGGWLACEIATKCEHNIAALVLVAPVGLRVGEPRTRTFLDIYAVPPQALSASLYGDEARRPDLTALTDEQFGYLARAQEAVAHYAWEPYFHSPTLADRLRRITVPTLVVGGGRDRFLLVEGYLEEFASRLGGEARVLTIPDAGHRVEEEAPAELARAIAGFARRTA